MPIYVVEQGDNVDIIAERFGVDAGELVFINQIPYPYALVIGQALLIPSAGGQSQSRFLSTNGYAYPFISREILDYTLPYLTELSIFSYGFTMEGYLIPPKLDDEWMIEAANSVGTKSILTLTPFGEDGKFNNNLISALVNTPESISRLTGELIFVMRQKGYAGVDVDFEYILADDRDAFTSFVAGLTSSLNEQGFQVSVALAPKTSSGQQGLLYEGKDYGGLGAAANQVLLMTYEWGYTYGPPMAVAPINKVRQVVEYAVTEIPVGKINMGIPNYGYDWPLPFESGVTKATTIGNVEAVSIAAAHGAVIQFDETAKSPYFRYNENNVEHEVWFEDVRSLSAKFDLVDEFNLNGVGYWQIMRLFIANWQLLESRFFTCCLFRGNPAGKFCRT